MARRPRIEFAGAFYHVISRGDHGEAIYKDEEDRKGFLTCVGEVCERTGWKVYAFVLMTNHYHMLLETSEPNLVAGMKWLQGTYTQRFNHRHNLHGHLFQGRYKALVIDDEEPGYFLQVSSYIHLNPIRAGLGVLGMREQDLQGMVKGAKEKQVLAWWLQKKTMASRKCISKSLGMGDVSRVTQAVNWVNRNEDISIVKLKKQLEEIS